MFGRTGVAGGIGALFSELFCIFAPKNQSNMKKKKDIFSKVEAEAREKLKHPDTRGAAQTVLEFIEKERKKLENKP